MHKKQKNTFLPFLQPLQCSYVEYLVQTASNHLMYQNSNTEHNHLNKEKGYEPQSSPYSYSVSAPIILKRI